MDRTVEPRMSAGAVARTGGVAVREAVRVRRRVLAVARPYLYILPTFFFLFVFTHYPILKTFYMSLFKWNLATPKKEFVGLANYVQAYSTPLFWQVFQNNVVFALGTGPITLALTQQGGPVGSRL